jgi:IclR family pca regulon transcriptional regulator
MPEVKGENHAATDSADPRFMASLARGLAVLSAFEGHSTLTVTQAARLAGLSRSSAARCLYTLECLGYVAAEGSSYRLSPALLPLSRAYAYSDKLAMAGQPVVDAIRDRLNESCSLAVLDVRHSPDTVIYVCRAETSRIISAPLLIGSTLPSYCTSMGRVLLAALPEDRLAAYLAHATLPRRTPTTLCDPGAITAELHRVRAQGWALIDAELDAGLRSIAVPVRKNDGRVVAALNVGVHRGRRSLSWMTETALPELQAAAAHLMRVA